MKKTMALVLVAGVAAAWFALRSGDSDDGAKSATLPDNLVNRIWLDQIPHKAQQKIDVFLMVDEPQFGQFLHTSAYEGEYSLFEWDEKDGKVEILMLQSDKKAKLSFEVTDKGCDPFDLCMKVKGAPRGAKKYFSMEDWVIEPHQGLGAGEIQQFLQAELNERSIDN